jgi:hypothetical protein
VSAPEPMEPVAAFERKIVARENLEQAVRRWHARS